jgi:alcohol dehydrogenase
MLSLKRGGRLVTCGSTSGVSTSMNLMMLFQQQLKLLGSFGCRMENMADAMQKMARGVVQPVIDTEVDLRRHRPRSSAWKDETGLRQDRPQDGLIP